ncbi:ABC transporter substrate-binding protein [Lysobacter korlensis]|uniref:ABC transporter substrate-binding protein n=1 Tax=Lysobacter korlensis TaxID=553636 RepID=A0ABV6S293_9GAMM
MKSILHRRLLASVAAAGVAGLALAGCTGDIENGGGGAGGDADCADYEQYGTFDGAEVTISGTIVEVEADRLIASWADFEECTGIEVEYQGTQEFEANIEVLAQGGNAPDLGIFPQPGLFQRLARGGHFVEPSADTQANVDEFWSEDWKGYGTVDGTFYGAPLMASIKGYVWYSPAEFEENGWEIPTTLDELDALSQQIAADSGHKPWCIGLGSDAATGWPATDWIEDFVLRMHGPEVYDQWIAHEIPFNDPQIVEAFDAVGDYIKNDDYVNGGLGDVRSQLSVPFGEGGLPILEGECSLHHQASFYEGFWGEGVTVAEDGDVWAFLTPPVNADDPQAVTGGGEIVGAFDDREEVQAFQTYLASDTWANNRVAEGGVISANSGLDPSVASSDLLVQSIEILQNPETTFRFDASDLMPGAVGADSFFRGIVDWIGGAETQEVVDEIESSWPAE